MSEKPVDLAALNELRTIMGDEFNLLIEIFQKDSAERLLTIEAAINSKDGEKLRGAAHSFKGSALNISAARLTELCRQLEFMGRDNQFDEAPATFEQVKTEYEAVKNFLDGI